MKATRSIENRKVVGRARQRVPPSPLALKVRAGAHERNALVHHPLAHAEVLVKGGPDLLGLDLVGL